MYGFHIDGFLRERVNIPARLAVKAPQGLDAVAAALCADHVRDRRAHAVRQRPAQER